MIKEIHIKDIPTFLNLFLSLYAVLLLFKGEFKLAAEIVFFNIIILDLMDGILARLTNTSNEFGKHLDSITDFIGSSFIVPFFIYKAYHESYPKLAIFLCFLPLLFGVLREIFGRLHPIKQENYFIGLPRNTAGLFIIAFLCSPLFHYDWYQYLGLPLLAGVSYLQLSYWPYLGNDKKTLVMPTRIKVYLYYAVSMIILSFFLGTFWEFLTVLLLGYILSPLAIVEKNIWQSVRAQYKAYYP